MSVLGDRLRDLAKLCDHHAEQDRWSGVAALATNDSQLFHFCILPDPKEVEEVLARNLLTAVLEPPSKDLFDEDKNGRGVALLGT
jgi:hypothetical protein